MIFVTYVETCFLVTALYPDLRAIVGNPNSAYFAVKSTRLFTTIQHAERPEDILDRAAAFLSQKQFIRIKPIEYIVHRQVWTLVLCKRM